MTKSFKTCEKKLRKKSYKTKAIGNISILSSAILNIVIDVIFKEKDNGWEFFRIDTKHTTLQSQHIASRTNKIKCISRHIIMKLMQKTMK